MVRPDKAHTCDYFHEPALGRASHHPTTSIPPHPSAFRNVSPFGPDPMAWEPSTTIQSHISYVTSTSLRTPYSSSSSYYSQELCPQLQATKHRYGTLDLCQRFLGCQREAGNGNSEHLMHGRHVTCQSTWTRTSLLHTLPNLHPSTHQSAAVHIRPCSVEFSCAELRCHGEGRVAVTCLHFSQRFPHRTTFKHPKLIRPWHS
ncbi:hypothetical protein HDK64DRAFT_98542 [Phyllosticta capitalensis]